MTPSELERRRLRATKGQLDLRWTSLGAMLSAGLGHTDRAILVDAEYQAAGVWTGLRGRDIERVERNRGVASVAPFARLPGDLTAWLGYQEVWDLESGRTPFAFRQASLTVHVGVVGDPLKPQLLRLEWPGLRDWDRAGVGFQSAGAGHPHWQIDLFESVFRASDQPSFEPDADDDLESFDAVIATSAVTERVTRLTFERMHLASGASWWLRRPAEFGSHHLHAPLDLAELTRWLDSAIIYIRQEITTRVVLR